MLINIFQNNSAVRTLKWKEIMEEFFACVADRVISSIQSHIELSKLENMQTKTPQKTKYLFDKEAKTLFGKVLNRSRSKDIFQACKSEFPGRRKETRDIYKFMKGQILQAD